MTDMPWRDVVPLFRHPRCQGAGAIHLVGKHAFYEEDDLPFALAEGETVLRVIPRPGFTKESLAGSPDERLVIADCPDDTGWMVPEVIIGDWMSRNVRCARLEDIILAHPLYEFLTTPDDDGHTRAGARGHMVHWIPGIPTIAVLHPPEFLPGDDDAPDVNRDRDTYADAVVDLLEQLEREYGPVEIEVGLRFGDDPVPWEDDPRAHKTARTEGIEA